MIGVHVCEPVLIEIPSDLAGHALPSGRTLTAGWAHGSRALDPARETRALDHRAEDENARHHAGFFALFDWLVGQDQQWLIAGDEDDAYYSHDHGHYFPGGPSWTTHALGAHQPSAEARLPADTDGLDHDELERLARTLEEDLGPEELSAEVSKLPATWPVSDNELEALVELADQRREVVAERLRSLIPEEDE